jgi:hypothetical protein
MINWRRQAAVVLLGLVVATVYLGNRQTLWTGDTLPARQLPVSILEDGDFYLDEFVSGYKPAHMHSVREVNGHWVSDYPVGAALMAVPFYLPARALDLDLFDIERQIRIEKIAASGIVLLSVFVMLATLRRVTDFRISMGVALIYGLGTSSLSTSSQALWQHGPSQLAMAAGLYCLVRGSASPRFVSYAGFPLAVAVVCRPSNLLMVAPLALYVAVAHRRRFPSFVACALPMVAFLLWYNTTYWGAPLHTQFPIDNPRLWTTPFGTGLAGLLISPGRGLFVYSPILIFSLAGFAHAWRKRSSSDQALAILRFGSVGVAGVVIVHCTWWSWWGGLCYGPRLLADTLPLLCLALYPGARAVLERRWPIVAAAVLAVWSVAAHVSGVYWDDGRWTGYAVPAGLWKVTDSPLVNPPKILLSRVAIAATGRPTSRSHPRQLSWSQPPSTRSLTVEGQARRQIRVTIDASNDGEAVWLAWPKRAEGSVRLRWELVSVDSHQVAARGVQNLRYDVDPGEKHQFQIPMILPPSTGDYELTIDLRVNRGRSFADLGGMPLTIPVRVSRRVAIVRGSDS